MQENFTTQTKRSSSSTGGNALKKLLVDTYAILAAATDSLMPTAMKSLLGVRVGRIKGVIHYLVAYEVFYHWRRGRLPGFESESEVKDYLGEAFLNAELTREIADEDSKIKVDGDEMLSKAKDAPLRLRKLSSCDATTIALGRLYVTPIISGNKDLIYVAEKFNVKIIW